MRAEGRHPISGKLALLVLLACFAASTPEAQAAEVLFATSFESGEQLGTLSGSPAAGGWHVETSSSCHPFTPHTGSRYLHEGTDSGNYASDIQYHYYTLPALDLSGDFAAITLSLYHWERLEDPFAGSTFDGANTKVSTDGGTSWALLTPLGGYPDSAIESMDDVSQNEPGWAQDSVDWQPASFDLTAYAGQGDVRIRFVFSSDVSGEDCGFAIDDVTITAELPAVPSLGPPGVATPLSVLLATGLLGLARCHDRRRVAGAVPRAGLGWRRRAARWSRKVARGG